MIGTSQSVRRVQGRVCSLKYGGGETIQGSGLFLVAAKVRRVAVLTPLRVESA